MEKKPQNSESRHADKYIVRFPDGMRDRIKEAAEANGRSMNAEIIKRLEQTFGDPDPDAITAASEALSLSKPPTKIIEAAKKWAEEISQPSHRPLLEALLATTLSITSQSDTDGLDDLGDKDSKKRPTSSKKE